jgi:hypothetical protein
MQVSPLYHSIAMALVAQRLARFAASFRSSIPQTDVRASDAPWIRAGLVVAVRAPRKVTQLWWLPGQQPGSLTKNP